MLSRHLLVATFAASRFLAAYVSATPDVYPTGSADASFDVGLYHHFAQQIREGNLPYRDFPLEYPPGSLTLILGPTVASDDYLAGFILMNVALDCLGFYAMWRLSQRKASWWAAIAWMLLVPALGPVAYTRLDMAVAVTLAWAAERLDAREWTPTSLLLGAGAGIKLIPALLLPIVWIVSPQRVRSMAAAFAGATFFFLPAAMFSKPIFEQVVLRNSERGVHVESLWGSLALGAKLALGAEVEVVFAYGAWDAQGSFLPVMAVLADLVAASLLVGSLVFTATRVQRGDGSHAVLIGTATLLLLVGVGRVLSPQYLLWLVPAVAASLAIDARLFRFAAGSFAVAVVLTHVSYPVLHWDYLRADHLGVSVMGLRNGVLLGSGLAALRAAWTYSREPAHDRASDAQERFPTPV